MITQFKMFERSSEICNKYYNAISKNDMLNLRDLIDNYGEVDCKDSIGWTPLMYARNRKNIIAMRMLIDSGADWNIKNNLNDDFLDPAPVELKKQIKKMYTEKYKEYIIKKDSEKYNL